jgi:preprotein translocase subunit SecG
MTVFPLLAVTFFLNVVAAIFLICAVALILIILIQKGRGGGLSAALGGAGAGGILGTKTGDFLTWVTITLVGVFLMLAIVMAKFYKPTVSDFGTEQIQQPPFQQSPVQEELPRRSELPPPTGDVGTATVGESVDANSLVD